MFKQKYLKYIKKLKKIQFGGGKEYYIFDIESYKWPRQLDNPNGHDSWFYCPLIWITLDRIYDDLGLNRRELLAVLGRPESDRERFFDRLMTAKWMEILEICNLLEKFENIIIVITIYLKDLIMKNEIYDFLVDNPRLKGWHISAKKQNELGHYIIHLDDSHKEIKGDFLNARRVFGEPAKAYIKFLIRARAKKK